MKIGEIPIRIFALIMANDLLDTVAQLFMKKGVGHFDSIFLWLGILFYVVNFFLWMMILTKVDLSIAIPMASVGYILIPLASILFLHEQVNLMRWIGIGFIMLGVYFVSKSKLPEKINA